MTMYKFDQMRQQPAQNLITLKRACLSRNVTDDSETQ